MSHLQSALDATIGSGGSEPPPAGPRRILVVEDSPMVAWLLTETLRAMGHDVCAVASTEEDAVQVAARERPDLLIVDVTLAQGSGLDAVRRIVARAPVAHLFMSGDILLRQWSDAPAVLLEKPFQDYDLARAIKLVCEADRATRR